MPTTRKLYQGAYRSTLDETDTSELDPTTQDADNSNTSKDGPANPEELSWKKRYGDLRTYQNQLTERIKELENQNRSLQKKEVKIPSTQEELMQFARQYPDVYRHIRSIAMAELLQERETISQETNAVKENLEEVKRELGLKKILLAHKDFEKLNASPEFHEWAQAQPRQIQEWLYESSDPDLCIKAIDLYKADLAFKKPSRKPSGADLQVPNRTPAETPDFDGKKVWKASEVQKMHPKMYEKYEDDIDTARREGRFDYDN